MAVHMLSVGSLFALRFWKCDHIEEKWSVLRTVEDRTTLGEVFESEHGELPKKYNILVKTSADDNPKNHFSVNPNLTIAEINRDLRLRYLYFECEKQEESLTLLTQNLNWRKCIKLSYLCVKNVKMMGKNLL